MTAIHITHAAALLGIALSLAACGLEGDKPHIYLENNSDQTIVLQKQASSGPIPAITAPPHQSGQTLGSPPYGHCLNNWEIVDENGHVLREIDRVCAEDHILYP